jgi:hypothetical protein
MLVDGDLAQADLSEHLGVAIDRAWNEQLTTAEEIAECCVHSLADRFCFLPVDPAVEHATAKARAARAQLWELLVDNFDVVLVDAGMWPPERLDWPDGYLATHVVVHDRRQVDDGALAQLIAQLGSAHPSSIRIVDNFSQ